MIREKLALCLIFLVVFTAFAQEPSTQKQLPIFMNVTKQAGIDFTHSFGDENLSSILETTGPGGAFLDYDRDGNLDIYVINGGYLPGINDPYPAGRDPKKELYNHLYRNNGDGTFADVTQETGVGDTGYGMGVTVADYDNNGYPDIYVCNYGPNVLYHNNGDGRFTDVTQTAGVAGPLELKGFPKWSVHACFLDYDKDGYLDLYVGNYLAFDPKYRYFFAPTGFPGPLDYQGQPDVLYHNNGDGTFTDVTMQAGVYNPDGRAMSVTAADFDNDDDQDIFVANDAMNNYLYRNNSDGTFTDVALEKGVALGGFGEVTSAMGPTFKDIDNDGDLDLFVPDMAYCCLYRNDGNMFFEDITVEAGISEPCGQYTSWSGLIFDYDNDSYPDIYISNGDAHHLYTEEDLLFRNNGNARQEPRTPITFEDVSLRSGYYFTNEEYVGRGAAFGDYDNDGDIDVLVCNLHGPTILLRNDGGNPNHWLTVHTIGTKSNRDGIGARIRVVAGDFKQIAEVNAGEGYLSCNDPRVHFGLGKHTKVDILEIRWPSGIVQTFTDVKADQILTVTEER